MGAANTALLAQNQQAFPGTGPAVVPGGGAVLGRLEIKEENPSMHYGNDMKMKEMKKKRRPKRLPPQTDPPTMPPGRGGRKMHRGPRGIAINPMNEMMGKGGGMKKMNKEEI
jgi:hypothetical protein